MGIARVGSIPTARIRIPFLYFSEILRDFIAFFFFISFSVMVRIKYTVATN